MNYEDLLMKKWDELTDREQLEVTVYEMHKDAYGYRDRRGFSHLTDRGLKAKAKYLSTVIAENEKMQAEREQQDVAEFKRQVALVREAGAPDFDTAIRWLYNNGGDNWCHQNDVEHWAYDQGILHTDFGRDVVARLESFEK
ncbi:MAG: hypothetical protein VW443_02370 [Pseudomonadales bacterium]